MHPATRRALPILAACLLGATPGAFAQPPVVNRGQNSATPTPFDASKLPPPVLLGARIEAIRRRIPVVDQVVIVPSKEAYVDALSRWRVDARFPVLIDDGSIVARENIARFVRAFAPSKVLRWEGENTVWAQSVEAQRNLMGGAIARAWGVETYSELPSAFRELTFIPPGVVLMSESDPAWTGGLALAIGRGQIPLWLTRDTDQLSTELSGEISQQTLEDLRSLIERELDRLGLPWRGLGDAIDAITIALNMPARVSQSNPPPGAQPTDDEPANGPALALTDLVGRHPSGERFAWAGILLGNEHEAAYRAMCALFLQPTRAWLFNGYKAEGAFANYSLAPTRQQLDDAGLVPTIDDAPFSGIQHWRRRLVRGVDAGFVHVNTSGMRRVFNLNPGQGNAGDIPILTTPAFVHFIHSFSAQDLSDRNSIARRWLENGAYAYVGSVDEPFLTAFHTPEVFIARLRSFAPLGAAARMDTSPPWKINIYGDPLFTMGPRADRGATGPELPDAVDLDDTMRDALRERRFPDAARALLALGRDADLARLYKAATRADDAEIDPEFAELALSSLWRTGEREALLDAARRVEPQRMSNSPLQDMLWHALAPTLSVIAPTPEVSAALRDNVRTWNIVPDVEKAAMATSVADSPAAARAFIEQSTSRTRNERVRQRIMELMNKY